MFRLLLEWQVRLFWMLAQLGQHAAGRFGMQECNVESLGTSARLLINQAHPLDSISSKRISKVLVHRRCGGSLHSFFDELAMVLSSLVVPATLS